MLTRLVFWSALPPRFPWCLGATVPKSFPSIGGHVSRAGPTRGRATPAIFQLGPVANWRADEAGGLGVIPVAA